jgi:hypothetical protein
MSWDFLYDIPTGYYVAVEMVDGVWIDPFGSVKGDDLLAAVRSNAQGWSPIRIDLDYGNFLFKGRTIVYGRADTAISAAAVNAQTRLAFDSFIPIAATDFVVKASQTLDAAPPKTGTSEWAGTLQLIAIAVIAVAVVYGIRQLKEISE